MSHLGEKPEALLGPTQRVSKRKGHTSAEVALFSQGLWRE